METEPHAPPASPRADTCTTMAHGAEAAELLLRDLQQRTTSPVPPVGRNDPARLRACESLAQIRAWAVEVGRAGADALAAPSAELLLAYRSAHGVARRSER